ARMTLFGCRSKPVARRRSLLAALPPPERLVILIRLLVLREADVTVDALHAVVRARVHLHVRPQPLQLRAEVDDELLRRLEHELFVLVTMLVEPGLAVVAAQTPEETR